jgi:hypothetical protein
MTDQTTTETLLINVILRFAKTGRIRVKDTHGGTSCTSTSMLVAGCYNMNAGKKV